MNIVSLIPYLYAKLTLLIFAFTRISALLGTFIIFRHGTINNRILVSLAVILSIYVVLLYQQENVYYDLFSLQALIQELYQILIGFLSGMILNIVFDVFVGLGQIVSTQIGLSSASVIDPTIGNITQLTKFYTVCITIVFFALNGHLLMLKSIVDSFTALPVGHTLVLPNSIENILNYSSIIFSGSIFLSITIVVAILVVNVGLATMTRFAPQFNIFSIGINLTLILGLIIIYLTFELFVSKGSDYLRESLNLIQDILLRLK